jgi:hypothetical protein
VHGSEPAGDLLSRADTGRKRRRPLLCGPDKRPIRVVAGDLRAVSDAEPVGPAERIAVDRALGDPVDRADADADAHPDPNTTAKGDTDADADAVGRIAAFGCGVGRGRPRFEHIALNHARRRRLGESKTIPDRR